jgi:branched-chain amino acid transport system substrate-binding protein
MKKILLACAAVFIFAGCTNKEKEATSTTGDILVGEYGSMTGSEATFGISTHKGIEMAFEETNAKGGIKGRKLKLISMDNQGKAEEAASVVTRLITQDKVVALLGEVASSRSLAAAPIAQKYKIPMITPSSTNPRVTEVGDYIFRVCFIDPFQGLVMAKFAVENLKVKNVAILKDMKSDYSIGLADFFKKTFIEKGGKIVSEQTYQSGEFSFHSQLTDIKAKKPEAIFVPGYYTEVGLIAQQVQKMGIKAILLGGDGWDSPKLYEIGKDAIKGNYFSNHYTTESNDPAVQNFIKNFKAKYSEVPDGLAAMGYDAAIVLINAMNNAKEITPQGIRDAIALTKDFPAVTGKITINAQRNAEKSAVVVRVDGDSNGYVTTIAP